MQLVDWIALGIIFLAAALGLLLGFGKLLKIFTGGIFGIIISIVVTYFCFGLFAGWLRPILNNLWSGMHVEFFKTIHLEKIILAIAIFIIVQILRILLVTVIKSVVEIENPIMVAFNRVLGMIFNVGIIVMLGMLLFHLVDIIGGSTEQSLIEYIENSKLGIYHIFRNNPLQYIIK